MYINKTTRQQVSLHQIMQETNASFPERPDAALLSEFGYAMATHASCPDFDPETHTATKDTDATEVNGAWVIGWSVEALSAEEILQRKAATARRYLEDTDWYAARLAETGEAIPEDVKAKRAECRETISQWKSTAEQ